MPVNAAHSTAIHVASRQGDSAPAGWSTPVTGPMLYVVQDNETGGILSVGRRSR